MAKYAANVGEDSISIDNVDLASAFGAGSEFALVIPNHGTPNITWQTVITGTITSITVNLEASLDGINWFVIDTSSSITGEIRSVSGSYRFIRINNSAVADGAGDELTASFVYSNSIVTPASTEEILSTVLNVSNAQAVALFTTPLTIVTGISGLVPVPYRWRIRKITGAYTIVGVTGLDIGWSTGGGQLSRLLPTSFLNAAGAVTAFGPSGPASGGSSVYADLGVINTHSGANLTFSAAGANPAGVGGGALTVMLEYYFVGL